MDRTAREIAGQAIIHGTLGFRASLEVTDHQRAAELCSQLLPWLESIGLAPRIQPFHREILRAAHGELPSDQQSESYWRGESASVLGWAIQVFEKPDICTPIDPNQLLSRLKLLRPEAADRIEAATLRPIEEIHAICAFCMAVRNRYQQLSLSEESAFILERIFRQRTIEFGLTNVDGAIEEASAFVAKAQPAARGLYVVRAIAAEWLLGSEDDDGDSNLTPS